MHDVRVEVTPRIDGQAVDVRGNVVKARLLQDLDLNVERVRSICGFVVRSPLDATALGERVDDLFVDPIIEVGRLGSAWLSDDALFPETPDLVITVGFKPGVTDNAGSAALDGLRTLFPEARIEGVGVATDLTYAFYGLPAGVDGAVIAASLHNPLIERALIQTGSGPNGWNQLGYPERPAIEAQPPAAVNLEVDDAALMRLSEEGLLALNLEEMQTIRDHYRDPQVQAARTALGLPPHSPTDVELECLGGAATEVREPGHRAARECKRLRWYLGDHRRWAGSGDRRAHPAGGVDRRRARAREPPHPPHHDSLPRRLERLQPGQLAVDHVGEHLERLRSVQHDAVDVVARGAGHASLRTGLHVCGDGGIVAAGL